jgi:hypothetical protein
MSLIMAVTAFGFIATYSEVPNRSRFSACSFNKSENYFLPARLFRPACLSILPNQLFLDVATALNGRLHTTFPQQEFRKVTKFGIVSSSVVGIICLL